MDASALYKAGKLTEAIDVQIKEVKANPGDMAKRLFLFELLAFSGDLDRARRQIEAINYDEPELASALLDYRKLLDAEQARRRCFGEGVAPEFLTEPPEHVRLRVEAVQRLRGQQPAEAAALLAQATSACPALHGSLNDKPFQSLCDCDDLFGTVLEVMAKGVYYWVPLEQIESLAMNAPRYARDLIWFPAQLAMRDGPAGSVFLPALYAGSHEHPDDEIKLGRNTDLKSQENGPARGAGRRVFLVGDDDAIVLLEWRQLQIDPA